MSDCTKSVTGRIDDLVLRLEDREDGSQELLTYNPDTGVASRATFTEGKQGRVEYGHVFRGRFIKSAVCLLALCLTMTGCTMQFDAQAHYPGKHNAIDTYETHPSKTVYKGYSPPFPMDPPEAYADR